jgi:hypothetical protein
VPAVSEGGCDYGALSLMQLLRAIAEGDVTALHELMDHRKPCRIAGRAVPIADLVEHLASDVKGRDQGEDQTIEAARDLTLNRFISIPDASYPAGPDCRRLYQACINHIEKTLANKSQLTALQRERTAEQSLQNQVRRHFQWSLRECRRHGSVRMRDFTWHHPEGTLRLRIPARLDDAAAQAWLERHFEDEVAPQRPGEAQRLQRRIEALAQPPDIRGLDDVDYPGQLASDPQPVPFDVAEQISANGLATAVAREKAEHQSRQRPAIRQLGAQQLQSLIERIFEALETDSYQPGALAKAYGLNKATFSRFAGLRWSESGEGRIPDLWRNTARLLAHDPRFRDAAEAAGVLSRVTEAAGEPMEQHDHGQ